MKSTSLGTQLAFLCKTTPRSRDRSYKELPISPCSTVAPSSTADHSPSSGVLWTRPPSLSEASISISSIDEEWERVRAAPIPANPPPIIKTLVFVEGDKALSILFSGCVDLSAPPLS